MKKLLFITLITACGNTSTNRAQVMVQAQAAKARCIAGTLGTLEVVRCEVPNKDKMVPWIAIYDTTLSQPFQAYPLEQEKQKEAPPAPPAPAPTPPTAGAGSGAAAPTPDASTK